MDEIKAFGGSDGPQLITAIALGILIAAALAPTVARGLAGREISHVAAGVFGIVGVVSTFVAGMILSD